MLRRRLAIAGLVCLVLIGSAVWLDLSLRHPPEDAPQAASSSSHDLSVVPPRRDRSGYVGNQACAECHNQIAADYHRSSMSHSSAKADALALAGLTASGPVADPHSGYVYHVDVNDGRLTQTELLIAGNDNYQQTKSAAYLVGSGHHAVALTSAENGYLFELPIGWFPHEQKWKLNPGYELKNQRFDRPIVPGCLACHGGFAHHLTPTQNRYELPVTAGIACEQCHGPGRSHVAFHNEGDSDAAADSIVNPGGLSPRLANDVCLQCHLQGDVVVYRDGADAFSFVPGDRLSDHRFDFLIETDAAEHFGVASHGSRMMRSRCYTESDGGLRCIHCHDPHRPADDFSQEFYDARCLSCHQPEACQRIVPAGEVKAAEGCVRCHMPRRKTREGQHLVYTDHWIHTPAVDEVERTPSLLPPNADVRLVNPWPQDDPQQAYLGMAYVQLNETMGPQLPAVEQGVELLGSVLASDADDLLARYWLASGLIARHDGAAAVGLLTEILKERPDWHKARFRLAVAYHQQNRYREAIAQYERIIHVAPDWLEPYPLVVRLHLMMKNAPAALRLLDQQLSYRPDATAYLNLALARQMAGRPLEECLAPIDDSLALDPRNVTAYLTRAYLFVSAGQTQSARKDYDHVLSIDPANRDAQDGLRATGKP